MSASRSTIDSNFTRHHSALAFGAWKWSGQRCQKHPWTCTAIRLPRSTTSARRRRDVPAGLASTRKRRPRACSSRRRASSGAVSRRLLRCSTRRTASLLAGGAGGRTTGRHVRATLTDGAARRAGPVGARRSTKGAGVRRRERVGTRGPSGQRRSPSWTPTSTEGRCLLPSAKARRAQRPRSIRSTASLASARPAPVCSR